MPFSINRKKRSSDHQVAEENDVKAESVCHAEENVFTHPA